MSPLLIQSLTAFFTTLLAIIAFAKIAPYLGLMDAPGPRNRHAGEVPLVGGLAIFVTLVTGGIIWGETHVAVLTAGGNYTLSVFLVGAGVLVSVGAVDDRFNLGVSVRILSEIIVALIVIEGLDLTQRNLGALIGNDPIHLPTVLAYPFTVIAIFGLINAFNMLDGIDGLLASLVLSTLLSFHVLTETEPGFISLFLSGSLIAFLISNLSLSPYIPKTFLGDAGSRLLGFIVVCLLLSAASSQIGQKKLIAPVTALYVAALPLFDMSFTVLRRIVRQTSPFRPDRSHIHHLMQNLGFSDRRSLIIITCLGLIVPSLGLLLNRLGASEALQFYLFLGSFCMYCLFMSQAWLLADKLAQLDHFDEKH